MTRHSPKLEALETPGSRLMSKHSGAIIDGNIGRETLHMLNAHANKLCEKALASVRLH